MLFDITQLYDRLKAIDHKHFYEIEADFFQCFCSNPVTASLPLINAFLIVSSWFGTSERSGVWTFCEATNPERIQNLRWLHGFLESFRIALFSEYGIIFQISENKKHSKSDEYGKRNARQCRAFTISLRICNVSIKYNTLSVYKKARQCHLRGAFSL